MQKVIGQLDPDWEVHLSRSTINGLNRSNLMCMLKISVRLTMQSSIPRKSQMVMLCSLQEEVMKGD